MREAEPGELERWVKCWKQAAPELAAERRARLRVMETATEVGLLYGPGGVGSVWRRPGASGLVEQQRIFSRWPR